MPPPAPPLRLGIPLAAFAGALWAVAVGLLVLGVLTLVGWAVGSHPDSTIGAALQVAGLGWLACHRAALGVPAGDITLLPLGFLILPLWLTHRAGRWAGRAAGTDELGDAALLVAAASVCYGLAAAVVAVLGTTPDLAVVPLQALLACGALAVVGFGTGVVRACGLWTRIQALAPAMFWRVVRAGIAAAAAYAALAAAVVGVALALHVHDAVAVHRALAPGLVGGVLLTLLGIGYLPVAVVWAGAFAAAPGFVVGDGTVFSLSGVRTGPLPALPMLAALPDAEPRYAAAFLLLPVLAGVIGGIVLLHRLPAHGTTVILGDVAGLAAVAGCCWALATALAAGALGPGRLGVAGAVWWQVGLAVAAGVFVGALLLITGDTLRIRFLSGPVPP